VAATRRLPAIRRTLPIPESVSYDYFLFKRTDLYALVQPKWSVH
jgi:hypothetical protein